MVIGSLVQPLRFAQRALLSVLTLTGFVLTALLVSSVPARADLRVCNQSGDQVSVALGYRAEKGWQSEGWWVAPPQKCAIIYQGDLHSRFFYLYVADDIGGGTWDGNNFMCTRDEGFTIFGVEDCLARGYERTGFFEVDTQNKTDWTLQLTDPVNTDTTTAAGTDAAGDAPLEGDSTDASGLDPGNDPGTDGTDAGTDPGADAGTD
jgi:uncharacterized membrane protein